MVCIIADSESESAMYLREIEPDIAEPDWDELALLTDSEMAFGAAFTTGVTKSKLKAIVPVKPKIRRNLLIILLPNKRIS